MSHLWGLRRRGYAPVSTDPDNTSPWFSQSSGRISQWDYPPRDPYAALESEYHPEFEMSSPESSVDQKPSTPSDRMSTPEGPYMTPFPQFSYPEYTQFARKVNELMVLELAPLQIQKIEYHGHTQTVPYINPTVPTHKIPILLAKSNRRFKCEYEVNGGKCKLAFGRKEHLRRHILTHTGVRAWVCHFCNQKFSRSDNLGKHVLEIHEKKKGARHKFKPKSKL